MKHRERANSFNSEELTLLQACFDDILVRRGIDRKSQDADYIAGALFGAFERGVTEKHELIRLADINA